MNPERGLSLRAAILLPIAVGFFGTLVSIAISSIGHTAANVNASSATESPRGEVALVANVTSITHVSTAAPVANTGPVSNVSTATASDKPVRLSIPSIGVNAAIQSVGFSKTNASDIGTPSNFVDVAWYNHSPIPGSPGIAIIDGHLDGRYVPKGVFYRLRDLTKGESVYVKDGLGVTRQFIVTYTDSLASGADTSMLFQNSGTPQLVLITCTGDWQPDKHEYTHRVVVFAALVS
jgi:LPXTG-site transpeptidase (sortase) family protein